jgi:hypothetical protein
MAESERADPDRDLKRLFAAMPPEGACLDDATWERLAGHELTPFERAGAHEHITTCAACGAIYRALRTLGGEARTFDPHVPAAPALATETSDRDIAASRPWVGVPQIAAALLALTTIGALAWWNVSLQRENARLETTLASAAAGPGTAAPGTDTAQVAELRRRLAEASAPQLNVPLVSLEPDALRGEPGAAAIVLPPDARLLTIVLNTADNREYQDHELKILDGRGTIVWTGRGLRKSPRNTFTLSVPREVLGVGEYRLELAGVLDGRPGAVQTYHVRITER